MRQLLPIVFSGALLATIGIADAQGITDSVYDGLKGMIVSEVREQCASGSSITQQGETFSLASNGNVIVRFGGFDCNWEFVNHYFCGARACTTREYEVSGSDIRLIREYLE